MRINSAKDDAAGLQIADRLTSQINGLNQGNRNASDGIALAQTVESGMDEISGMLQKIRTLAVQANNGTNTGEDKAALSKEASALANEISRIARQTTFAGKTLLDGAYKTSIYGTGAQGTASKGGSITLQVGSNKGDTISFSVNNMVFSVVSKRAYAAFDNKMKDNGVAINGNGVTFKLSAASVAAYTIEMMDAMISDVDAQRANLGAIQNHINALKKIKKTKCL